MRCLIYITAPGAGIEPGVMGGCHACLPGGLTAGLTDAVAHKFRGDTEVSGDIGQDRMMAGQ